MSKKTTTAIRKSPFLVIAFFLIIGIIGISFEEPSRVLEQALQVCLSCIGLG
nr:hypothetical protein [Desulfobulbaceae bacterium]